MTFKIHRRLYVCLLALLAGCQQFIPASSEHVSKGDELNAKFANAVAKEFPDNPEINSSAVLINDHAMQDSGIIKQTWIEELLKSLTKITGYDLTMVAGILGLGGTALRQSKKKNHAEKKLLAKLQPQDAEKELNG